MTAPPAFAAPPPGGPTALFLALVAGLLALLGVWCTFVLLAVS